MVSFCSTSGVLGVSGPCTGRERLEGTSRLEPRVWASCGGKVPEPAEPRLWTGISSLAHQLFSYLQEDVALAPTKILGALTGVQSGSAADGYRAQSGTWSRSLALGSPSIYCKRYRLEERANPAQPGRSPDCDLRCSVPSGVNPWLSPCGSYLPKSGGSYLARSGVEEVSEFQAHPRSPAPL